MGSCRPHPTYPLIIITMEKYYLLLPSVLHLRDYLHKKNGLILSQIPLTSIQKPNFTPNDERASLI